MIEFIIGKPGDGKTMKAVRMMLDHFRTRDDRYIVTNVRLKLPPVVEWLVNHSHASSVFWYDWIEHHYQLLDETQLVEFFRYRGDMMLTEDTDIPAPGQRKIENGKRETVPNLSLAQRGVVYFLDEVHTVFGARNWAKSSNQVLHYLTQHRKPGDDVYCITQNPKQVDVQFRMNCQAYHVLRNQYRQKFFAFKMPGKFSMKSFTEPPQQHSVAYETSSFVLEPGIGKCYDTTAGVGLGGGRAPELKKAKGFPLWSLYVAAVVFVVLVMKGVGFASEKFTSGLMNAEKKVQSAVSSAVPVPSSAVPASKQGNVKKEYDEEGKLVGEVPLPDVVCVWLTPSRQVLLGTSGGQVISANDSGYAVSILGNLAKVNGVPVKLIKE